MIISTFYTTINPANPTNTTARATTYEDPLRTVPRRDSETARSAHRQNGLNPSSWCSVMAHLERFGTTQKEAVSALISAEDAHLLRKNFASLNHDPLVVAAVVALVHRRYRIFWKVIPQSCLPELLYKFAAQIAAAVSGRYDQFDRYRSLLSEKESHLNGDTLNVIVYFAMAAGFADKWRFVSNRRS